MQIAVCDRLRHAVRQRSAALAGNVSPREGQSSVSRGGLGAARGAGGTGMSGPSPVTSRQSARDTQQREQIGQLELPLELDL